MDTISGRADAARVLWRRGGAAGDRRALPSCCEIYIQGWVELSDSLLISTDQRTPIPHTYRRSIVRRKQSAHHLPAGGADYAERTAGTMLPAATASTTWLRQLLGKLILRYLLRTKCVRRSLGAWRQ